MHTKELGQLGGGNNDCRGIGETVDHRMGEEIDEKTEP